MYILFFDYLKNWALNLWWKTKIITSGIEISRKKLVVYLIDWLIIYKSDKFIQSRIMREKYDTRDMIPVELFRFIQLLRATSHLRKRLPSLSFSFLNYYTLALRRSLPPFALHALFGTWILLSRNCFRPPSSGLAVELSASPSRIQQEQRIRPKCIGSCVHVLFPFNRVSTFKITFP